MLRYSGLDKSSLSYRVQTIDIKPGIQCWLQPSLCYLRMKSLLRETSTSKLATYLHMCKPSFPHYYFAEGTIAASWVTHDNYDWFKDMQINQSV